MAGYSVNEISARLKLSTTVVIHAINNRMKTELSLITAEDRAGILQLEMDRYDALQAAHWDMAMAGDPISSGVVLKIFAERAKRLQLDAFDPQTQHQTILVVAGSEAEYIKSLQAADEEDS